MKWEGNVRKMSSRVDEVGNVTYSWSGKDICDEMPSFSVNEWLGKHVQIFFEGSIHCVVTGAPISKTFGEGMSYRAFMESPLACPSIIRPELSRIHEGIALRDEAWEREHHLAPHVVYLSQTSHLKVGVTRASNVPSRWVDQGASMAAVVAHAPYRQLAGEMEVALKEVFSDRTHWRRMLSEVSANPRLLLEAKEECFDTLGIPYESFFEEEDVVQALHFPVQSYPSKVQSAKLDKSPLLEGKLVGIKGQYWLFEDGRVWNVRSHAGYRIVMNAT